MYTPITVHVNFIIVCVTRMYIILFMFVYVSVKLFINVCVSEWVYCFMVTINIIIYEVSSNLFLIKNVL